MTTRRRVGVAWYRRDDYQRVRQIMDDAHTLPDTYDEWAVRIEKAVEGIAGAEVEIIKIYIDPQTFSQWCKQRGYKRDLKARGEFATVAVSTL